MAYEVVMPYHLHMPSYFLETFTEYPFLSSFPYLLGLTLKCFLNTSLKYLLSQNPVISATSVIEYFFSATIVQPYSDGSL